MRKSVSVTPPAHQLQWSRYMIYCSYINDFAATTKVSRPCLRRLLPLPPHVCHVRSLCSKYVYNHMSSDPPPHRTHLLTPFTLPLPAAPRTPCWFVAPCQCSAALQPRLSQRGECRSHPHHATCFLSDMGSTRRSLQPQKPAATSTSYNTLSSSSASFPCAAALSPHPAHSSPSTVSVQPRSVRCTLAAWVKPRSLDSALPRCTATATHVTCSAIRLSNVFL